MKKKTEQNLILATTICLSSMMIMWVLSHQLNTLKIVRQPLSVLAENSHFPKAIYPCLPQQFQKLEVIANTSYENNNYYLVGIYQVTEILDNSLSEYRTTLVKEDEIGCLVLMPTQKSGKRSLAAYLPLEVARALALQKTKKAIEKVGGKQKYQELLNNSDDGMGEVYVFFPEDVWALKKLGLEIPGSAQIVEGTSEIN